MHAHIGSHLPSCALRYVLVNLPHQIVLSNPTRLKRMGPPPPGCRASEAVGRERLGALPVFVMALQVGSSNGPTCKPSAAATRLSMRHRLPHCPAGTCMQAGVTPQPLQFFIFQCVPFIMPEHWASGAICEDLPGYTIHSEASMRQVR